ncbi:polyprenyl synthetase family protein [Streptomyces sp. NRRL B-1347]|uniref:polyprenyl synthetase family protein n=1 Tax=Streptomyces sp. NRRL B-1347 TaxID=1476877 RepID=UPI00099D9D15|nr:polyprenyl synthetase family protein [Streptomyces sp. NRRL B-1347]
MRAEAPHSWRSRWCGWRRRWICSTPFALVHDDIIDDSPRRRGQPTVHRLLAQRHGAGRTDDVNPLAAWRRSMRPIPR